MTLETSDQPDRTPTVGIDAATFDQYSAIETEEAALIIYDEQRENAWIQSDYWIPSRAVG